MYAALVPMAALGVSEELERSTHDLALPRQLGGPLPDGCANVWEYMLSRIRYLDTLRHWSGPTGWFAPLATRHPERLAWVFAWNEGSNRKMAQRPRPVDADARFQEDLQCTWWPILVDTTFSHSFHSPSRNGYPGVCPPQVDNKSQVWWWDRDRLFEARGSPRPALPGVAPPVVSEPEPQPQPPAAATGAHGASSSSSSGAADSGAHGARGAPLPGGSDNDAWKFDDDAEFVETPGPTAVELDGSDCEG